jgi:hypothetical protein
VIASDVLDRVSAVLCDVTRVRWTVDMLLDYLTDAMRQTVLNRPDANATVEVVALTPNTTKQRIPVGAVRFLGLLRNMGADGLTAGAPIMPTTRESMDASLVSWHTDAPASVIDNYLFNADTPEFFYVSPRPVAGVYVEMEYARDVPQVAVLTETLPLSNVWAEPLREYVLYRAYSVNAASQVDGMRAMNHLKQYYLAVGEEGRAKAIFSPYLSTLAAAQAGGK